MIHLAILWHMHQPYYEDLATGEHVLPWVRLHAVKDYFGMVALAGEFPGVRLTFNLVPSLLVQLRAFAEDRARDRHLAVGLQAAETLQEDDRRFLLANGFHAHPDRMIKPYPRYAELYARRRHPEEFDIAALRDLQVWHKLVWMDPDWLAADPRLVKLVAKGQDFSEEDKADLREVELELLRSVVPAYRDAAARGQIELSTSPFYHAILPLVCDSDTHLAAHPHSMLPRALVRWPGDAREQLTRAVALHTSLFERPPGGVWPSEGAVSDEAVRLIAETGSAWTASDEAILWRSLGGAPSPGRLYRPYEIGDGRPIRCLFRDHQLSDLIGFSYQSWPAEGAADDFLRRVREAGRRFQDAGGGEVATISVILDGENAWEHYPGGGRPFLRALYGRLQEAADIRTVTMSEAAAAPAARLTTVFPGSWINGDLYIWAGHPDDHRAWSQLARARAAYDAASAGLPDDRRVQAYEELLIAEGSDWFWWYGDDHSSVHDRDFDELFRAHLRNVYRALGEAAPDDLYATNITTAPQTAGPLAIRTLVAPLVDGRDTGFAEWAGAAPVSLGAGGATMHRVSSQFVRGLRVGLGQRDVFLRLDGAGLARAFADGKLGLAVLVGGPHPRRIELKAGMSADGVRVGAGHVVEVALALASLGVNAGDRVRFRVLVTDADGHAIEQHPANEIEIATDTADLDRRNWRV